MTDDDFDKVDQDFASEFDFVDTAQGGAAAGAAEMQPTASAAPQPKGSPAVVSLMVLISILGGGYFVYTHFFAKSPTGVPPPAAPKSATEKNALPTLPEHMAPPETPPALQTTQEQAATVAEAALPPPTPSGEKSFEQMQKEIHTAQPPAAVQPQQTVPSEVRAALQNISEEMTSNVNNMRQLEGTIANMAITLDNLNKTISAMDNRVLSLTETVDGLSQDVSNVKKVIDQQDLDLTMPGNVKMNSGQRQLQNISSTEPSYSVHAIIPGRAWLKSASGQIITVTEGDTIGDYGTVAVIDASNGLVRTSSGIIIR